jgi:hypothetical protein
VLLFGTFICLAVFLLLLSCILYYNYAKTAGGFLEQPLATPPPAALGVLSFTDLT